MYRISFWGTGNAAYRLSLALKAAGHSIPYICGRNTESGDKLVHILNKLENDPQNITEETKYTTDFNLIIDSDVVILAVSDDAIAELSQKISKTCLINNKMPVILHISGACSIDILNSNKKSGVLYPLMTLSKVKPVDFKIVPFFIEFSNKEVETILINIVFSLGAEYRYLDSHGRLKIHLAAVYVSNFINYLAGLAFDLSKPNQIFLLPLAIETVRKAFLYDHPSLVQTGPAKRKDLKTMEKHLELLDTKELEDHKEVYEMISRLISNKTEKNKI
jgi:predicted short-subunit dehydrogenase-like oxidoreductase (DUF2520 family)